MNLSVTRMKILMSIVTICISLLIVRVFYLQVVKGDKFSKAAAVQRVSNTDFDKPRGNIYDRNGIRLTNRNERASVVLQPLILRGKTQEIEKLNELLSQEKVDIKKQIRIKKEPIIIDTSESTKKSIIKLNIQGVSIINSLKRYDEFSVARHLLGYLRKSDQIGETGVEKFYENILKVDGESKIGVITDARNNLIEGMGYRIMLEDNLDTMYNVRLTIDYHMQRIVDDVMDDLRVAGAVVVEDVFTGDILAITSKPDFDQNDVSKFLENSNNALFNRATASYNIGSIFKILDLAKYLELNLPVNQQYFCPGYIKIGDKEFRCSSYAKGGHGSLNLKEAFANSCNTYFINAGIKMGYKNIYEISTRFGLGKNMGLSFQGVVDSYGKLPDIRKNYTDGDIANIAIGQGEVMVTPLQITDLIATIANGGIRNRVNIVDSIIDDNLSRLKTIRTNEEVRVISKDIADKVKLYMEEVTLTGTGTKARLAEFGGAAGKTGSAETGQYINGKKVVHAWFGGYFPLKQPRYSMTVFVEDGKAGGEAAAPIFAEIAQQILKKGF